MAVTSTRRRDGSKPTRNLGSCIRRGVGGDVTAVGCHGSSSWSPTALAIYPRPVEPRSNGHRALVT